MNAAMHREFSLHSMVEKVAPQWISLLQDLVRIPSFSGDEQEAQKKVTEIMRDLGIFNKHVYFKDSTWVYSERNYLDRPNVVGLIPGCTEKNFILNAHIDTTPVEDPDSWEYPPLSGIIHDGKLHGRGALDDKAGIAMILMIAHVFKEMDLLLPCNVYFESVFEDEDTGNGTKACLDDDIYADAAIVVDGTWPFRIIDSHLGQIWIEFTVTGTPVAACSSARGNNPINSACKLIQLLSEYAHEKNRTLPSWHNVEKPFFASPGVVRAGNFPGAVPEKCYLVYQIGFPPPNTVQSVCNELDSMIAVHMQETGTRVDYNIGLLGLDSFEHRNNAITRMLLSTISRVRHGEMTPVAVAVTGHCDLRNIRKKNGDLADACLYGPGGGGNPHVKDEFYLIDHFVPVAQNIISTILSWSQT
jgi:acetylornithine deacetylase